MAAMLGAGCPQSWDARPQQLVATESVLWSGGCSFTVAEGSPRPGVVGVLDATGESQRATEPVYLCTRTPYQSD